MEASWREKVDEFKIPIALSLVGMTLIIGGVFVSGLNKQKPKDFPKESLVETQKIISVDVSGAVRSPGVYKLDSSGRVEDAVKAAGGVLETANGEYISKYLNMAQKLSDGMKIYIPLQGEVAPLRQGSVGQSGAVAGSTAQAGIAQVNINMATEAELEALPGIGPVTASKIISSRPYQKIEDLTAQKIVSKATFEKIKDSIVVF